MKRYLLLLLTLTLGLSVRAQDRCDIIPAPKAYEEMPGAFRLRSAAVEADPAFAETAADLSARLAAVTGLKTAKPAAIRLVRVEGLPEEAYRLEVTQQQVTIEATDPAGAFYGVQSFLQLLPAQVYGDKRAKGVRWTAPCCRVEDRPHFPYRGMHLDVGRYFMPKETVMRFIDLMAMHKQNMFHWHLTEDQGWRIEIKKYPRLTEVGAWRPFTADYRDENPDGTPHGGFYTQDDVREVVEYARRRFVTVIPEIELPGHASAAIAAYPQLSCNPDAPHAVATSWGVKTDVFCPNAFTFQFLEDVFTELFDLFPSPYYHIGGDECPKDAWMESDYCKDLMKVLGITDFHELQTFFVRRMDSFLRAHGKTVIGWDEILDGSAVESTVVMSYRGHAPAAKAIQRGMKTILVPNRWTYLDYYQMDPALEPKAQSLYLPIDKVYNYFPAVDSLRTLSDEYIIGYECCVWGEYAQTPERVEYLAFPRAVAAAEVAWCDRGEKDWDSFYRRMRKEFGRLDAKGVRYNRALHDEMFNGGTAYREIPGQLQWKEQ
ncbi:MAG: beta-N-acetylhexosaminidase [Bacteroidales bacterium]|nr:beta-N-acetylhexosaminidase [Bacteroidales bacterium]